MSGTVLGSQCTEMKRPKCMTFHLSPFRQKEGPETKSWSCGNQACSMESSRSTWMSTLLVVWVGRGEEKAGESWKKILELDLWWSWNSLGLWEHRARQPEASVGAERSRWPLPQALWATVCGMSVGGFGEGWGGNVERRQEGFRGLRHKECGLILLAVTTVKLTVQTGTLLRVKEGAKNHWKLVF